MIKYEFAENVLELNVLALIYALTWLNCLPFSCLRRLDHLESSGLVEIFQKRSSFVGFFIRNLRINPRFADERK
jgi:hypothetical protein